MSRIAPAAFLAATLVAGAASLAPLPAAAQTAPLVIYGNDRCPTDANGNEIVVCVRRGEEERFRIPKELREFEVTPQNESWAQRVESNANVGATGTGSCSNVGANGATGCFVQGATSWKKQEQKRRAQEDVLPK